MTDSLAAPSGTGSREPSPSVSALTGFDPSRDEMRAVYFDPADIVVPDLAARPWPKACSECAFHPHDPQGLGAEVRAMLRTDVLDDEVEFYCVHRLTRRGLHRLCASAAAIRASRDSDTHRMAETAGLGAKPE